MPTYRIVFSNGEKRQLKVRASEIQVKENLLKLRRDDDGYRDVAVIPLEKVLYVVEVKDDENA